jgi:hypothetical protein
LFAGPAGRGAPRSHPPAAAAVATLGYTQLTL